ncbi:fungal-specific transcription factor domain-containing protein [Xylariales sp. PMI_506]|nr:fungal-specific transcription factor domain-containing protein [Xylariales sp. PMI_506]
MEHAGSSETANRKNGLEAKSCGPRPLSGRRFRGLTCANCRIRKVRCEGGQPTCKTCEVYHDNCRYDKSPPLSQVIAMARRLKEAEKMIEQLQKGSHITPVGLQSPNSKGQSFPSPSGSKPHDQSPQNPMSAHSIYSQPISNSFDAITATPKEQDQLQVQPHPRRQTVGVAPEDPAVADLSVDEHGKICYYGPTSAVHDPPELYEPSPATVSGGVSSKTEIRSYLTTHAKQSAIWEDFALGNAALETGIPRLVMGKLLHLHWAWVAPMFMWVYRPAFLRDMTTGGRYYSEFLLTVLCAHASKYQDNHCTELLVARARRLLGDAIQQPSSIPTVQALLQLSAQELARGEISQAWVYSGIAFRMATDLGLQHNGPEMPSLNGLSAVDLEIRRRLFWSCYFWDKATSLYTGRLPAITELPQSNMGFLDDSAELELWSPYYEDSLNLTKLPLGQYPTMRSHAVSCFANSCKLSVIINDIIIHLYSRKSRAVTETSLRDIKIRLEDWRTESPVHLRLEPNNLPSVCPPPHILSQNLLYFTTVILAHRPFWSIPSYYSVCIEAAQSIEKLVLLLETTFPLENITYLMGYCIYTGASATLEDAKNDSVIANTTMQTFLRALNAGMKKCPIFERSLNIIIKGLKRPQAQRESPDDPAVPENAIMNSYIPAFPFDTINAVDSSLDSYLSSSNMETMTLLDSFPELQMDWTSR